MEVSSGRPVGVEALIRWQSSVLGSVSPADFIPVAEESGLISRIGLWVIDTGLAQLRRWEAFGDGSLYMSLNVSPRQLLDPRFETELEKRLRHHGIDTRRHRISLEITETAFMTDLERGQQVAKRLRELGLQIHLDDFGTGYSSLGYLKRLPVDRVKADLSFVRDIDTDPDSEALTRAIVAMSHSLGLTTVAEGVETEKHLEKLRKLHCDYAQGYYFAKPMPADEATLWLQKRLNPRPG
jgi:EAL domain-containing protein (putative c-di-GMP-specific phosphodiesterase class I)